MNGTEQRLMAGKSFLQQLKARASKNRKHLVLPDSLDERTIRAAELITREGISRITLIGSVAEIAKKAKKIDADLAGVNLVDPDKSGKLSDFSRIYLNLRKGKEPEFGSAEATMRQPLYFAAMMVREGLADGSVAGSLSTTADVLRAGIRVVGLADGGSIVSSFFIIVFPERVYTFADCGVVPDPDAGQLAEIAVTTARNHEHISGEKPRIAMLSFSTKGSADHPSVEKMRRATELVRRKFSDLQIDGELQVDAAIVPMVAKQKAPESPLEGNANVLIFPDLNSGNIAYKIAERMGKATAFGPIVQGLRKPCSDLSRGCTVDDIVNVVAINALMATDS